MPTFDEPQALGYFSDPSPAGASRQSRRAYAGVSAINVAAAAVAAVLPAYRLGNGTVLSTWQVIAAVGGHFNDGEDATTTLMFGLSALLGVTSAALLLAGPWLSVAQLRRPRQTFVHVVQLPILVCPPWVLAALVATGDPRRTRVGLWLFAVAFSAEAVVLFLAGRHSREAAVQLGE